MTSCTVWRAVRERGPAVDVFLVPPWAPLMFMDEMAHVLNKAAEPVGCPAQQGRHW
ncbi:hypothetical protein [Streptomyces sp. NPDC007172]|uniref:hypothetical protein n=1 Tax=Streptomyces sp. NPDC007172 TaxID=3364776 RepID=UPI00367C3AF1